MTSAADAPVQIKNVIDGKVEFALEGRDVPIIDPATAEQIGTAAESDAADVARAVDSARVAFDSWSTLTPKDRSEGLLRLADIVEEHAEELARLESRDAGKPLQTVIEGELPAVLDNLRFFAGAARNLEGASGVFEPDTVSFLRREPIGVVGQVAPWNYPLAMAAWKAGPALAAGCTSVLKPAPTTTMSTVRFAELAAEVLPPGVLNVVVGGTAAGQALVEHPEIAMVSLTGSIDTGRWIAERAGGLLKRTHLELGGKAPVVVFADADLERALDTIAEFGYFNAGQDCVASARVLVEEGVQDAVVEGLKQRAEALVMGAMDDPATTLGPVNNERQLASVTGFFDRLSDNAEVITGGRQADRAGYFVEPTVIAGVTQDDEVSQREIFGPVITVQTFSSESEAVQAANNTGYGLAASVWTADAPRSLRVSSALRFGTVWVNTHGFLVSEMPHGGIKQSGHGSDLSKYSVEEYTYPKHVMASTV